MRGAILGMGFGLATSLVGPAHGQSAPDPSLERFLRGEGRTAADIVKLVTRSGSGPGASRVIALANQWEKPALLAAESNGKWVVKPLAAAAEVRTLELRDLSGDGEPEVVVRQFTESRRVDHTTRLTTLTVWKLSPSGFAEKPIFQLPERVEEHLSPERSSHPSAFLEFRVSFEPARPRGAAKPRKPKPPSAAMDIVVTLVRDHIDNEHPALAGPHGHRKPTAWAGRWFWNKDLKGFFRDPRSPALRETAPAPGRS